jgi:pimeloyl-ACP methyl ester carboxylesterase
VVLGRPRPRFANRTGDQEYPAHQQGSWDNAKATLADFRNSIGEYPSRRDLATAEVPVVCTYGARSPESMFRLTRLLASAIPTATVQEIEGAGHAAPFDATTTFVQLIANAITAFETVTLEANGGR